TSHEEEVLGWNNQRHPNKHIAYLCLVPNLCSTRHTNTHTHKHTHTYTHTHTHTHTQPHTHTHTHTFTNTHTHTRSVKRLISVVTGETLSAHISCVLPRGRISTE